MSIRWLIACTNASTRTPRTLDFDHNFRRHRLVQLTKPLGVCNTCLFWEDREQISTCYGRGVHWWNFACLFIYFGKHFFYINAKIFQLKFYFKNQRSLDPSCTSLSQLTHAMWDAINENPSTSPPFPSLPLFVTFEREELPGKANA